MKREHLIFGLLLLAPIITLGFTYHYQSFGTAFWVWLGLFFLLGVGLRCLVRQHARHHTYECPVCHHNFAVSTFIDLTSPHYPGHKSLVCPQCGKRSWCVEVEQRQSDR